jgi:hypothetical protein
MAIIGKARRDHLATRVMVEDQIKLGFNSSLALCADPNSKSKYPTLPNCTTAPENWFPFGSPPPTPGPAPTPVPRPVPSAAFVGCYWDKGYPAAFHNKSARGPCDLPHAECGSCPKAAGSESFREVDLPDQDQDHDRPSCKKMTLEMCESNCAGYAFFAVQNGGTGCFCGSEYGKYGKSTNCTMPCEGDAHEVCGGSGANSIYRARNTSSVAEVAVH